VIIRTPRPESHYLTIANSVVRDRSLSFKARGILALLLSYPDNWSVSSERLARETETDRGEKRDAIRTGLKELEGAGYLRREVRRDKTTGRMSTNTYVYDTPRPVEKPRDNALTYPQPTTDYPASDKASPIEVPTKKDQTRKSLGYLRKREQNRAVCPQCHGQRWTLQDSDLIPCPCDSGLVRA
jgi:hypothetical protein